LAATKDEPRLDDCLFAGVGAIQIYDAANHGTGRRADRRSTSDADCNTHRSRQGAQQGAYAHTYRGREDRMRFLAVNLKVALVIAMDNGGTVHGNLTGIVELPKRMKTFVSFAFVVKHDSDEISHETLLSL
jgi:hypothetical protein